MARADGFGPSVFTPLITDTFVGTDTDTQGDTYSFDFTVEVGPNGLSLLPAQWAAYWGGTLTETGPNCPTTCHDYFSDNGAGFFPYGTPDQIPGLPATPNQVTLWSWGDFTCTAFDSFGDCVGGTSEYNLEANQYGAEIVGPAVAAPEPSTLVFLVCGALLFGIWTLAHAMRTTKKWVTETYLPLRRGRIGHREWQPS
jgi:hypothetical protein